MNDIKIRFEEDTLDRLRRFASSRDISVAHLVRLIVEDFFARKEAERKP